MAMRVLIRYNEDKQFKTCVRESTTMNGAEEVLLQEKPNVEILSSSIIENGRDYQILTGGYMLCNSK